MLGTWYSRSATTIAFLLRVQCCSRPKSVSNSLPFLPLPSFAHISNSERQRLQDDAPLTPLFCHYSSLISAYNPTKKRLRSPPTSRRATPFLGRPAPRPPLHTSRTRAQLRRRTLHSRRARRHHTPLAPPRPKTIHTYVPSPFPSRTKPLKQFAGDNPLLPLHPLSARITTLINSSPEEATPERLVEVECTLYPLVNRTSEAERRWEERFGRRKGGGQQTARSVSFRRVDGMVRLGEAGSRFWMGGREVEGAECR